jgi:hypothetical protein
MIGFQGTSAEGFSPMYRMIRVIALAVCALSAASSSAFGATPTEACSVLTAAQVSSTLGTTVDEGTYIMPSFKATCTWNIQTGGSVTLQLQTLSFFNAGKGSLASAERTSISGVGDEAYYLGEGPTTGLAVRKGDGAFKISVYSRNLTLEQRKAIERALAQQALMTF